MREEKGGRGLLADRKELGMLIAAVVRRASVLQREAMAEVMERCREISRGRRG